MRTEILDGRTLVVTVVGRRPETVTLDFSTVDVGPRLQTALTERMAALAAVDGTWGSPVTLRTGLVALRSLFRNAGVVEAQDLSPRIWREALMRLSPSTRIARAAQLSTFFLGMPGVPMEFLKVVEATRIARVAPETTDEVLTDSQIELLRKVCFDTVRDALARVRTGWELIESYRSGEIVDQEEVAYAAVLDEIARTGDIADRYPSNLRQRRVPPAAMKRMYPGQRVKASFSTIPAFRALYPTTEEAAACALALVVTCGWNLSPALDLSVSDISRLDARDGSEPVHLRVRLSKGRLGQVSDWHESYFDGGARSKARLVLMIQELTEGARRTLATRGSPTDQLLVCLMQGLRRPGAAGVGDGCPLSALADLNRRTVLRYLAEWRESHPELSFATPRALRHFFVVQEHPQGHSFRTNADYVLRSPRMRADIQPVVEDGIQAAFDDAMARIVNGDEVTALEAPTAGRLGILDEVNSGQRDTVAAACQDYEHYPPTNERCHASFLTCFACRNAVVLKRHLPRILALVEHMDALRAVTEPTVWEGRFEAHYVRVSSLVVPEKFFSGRDIDSARTAVTEHDRSTIKRLMAREWDV